MKKCLATALSLLMVLASFPLIGNVDVTAYADDDTVEIIVPVAQDTYVNGGTNAAVNYGTATDLMSRHYDANNVSHRIAFMTFDLSAVNIPGDIVSAELLVNARKSAEGAANPRFIFDVKQDWNEDTLNYSNYPRGANLALIEGSSFAVDNLTSEIKKIDLTQHIKLQKASGAQNVKLAILGTSGNTDPAKGPTFAKEFVTIYFKSKESGTETAPSLRIISTSSSAASAPMMTNQTPANDATNVPLDSVLLTTFQEEIFPGSQFAGISLTRNGEAVAATVTTEGNTLKITPNEPLLHGSTFQLLIPAGAVNSGSGVPLGEEIVSEFHTVTNHPYVASSSPASDAYNVQIDTPIEIHFNEAVVEDQLSGVVLSLAETSVPVPATVGVSGATMTIAPNNPLEYASEYNLTIPADAVKSLYDLPLIQPVNVSFKTVGAPREGSHTVDSIRELEEALAQALPGSEIILADGEYADAQPVLSANGTAEKPITIRSETPGGARFTGVTGIILSGSHLVFRDFLFDKVVYKYGHSVRIVGGNTIRVTGNYFYQCGDSETAYSHIVRIEGNSQHNRIDHNTFEDSRGMSVGVKIGGEENRYNLYNTIDHNYFRNIRFVADWFPGWENGMESIQIGQGTNNVSSYATIEYNLFENVTGDKAEIISNKSSHNTIRYNTFLNSWSGPTNRMGNGSVFSDNFFFNGKDGVRSYGSDQIIANNYFFNISNTAIQLPSGSDSHDRSQNTKIVNNTIVYSGTTSSISIAGGNNGPLDTLVANNLIMTNRAAAIANSSASTAMRSNGLYAWGDGTIGNGVNHYLREDFNLKRDGLLFRPTADSLAVDFGTPYENLPLTKDMDGQLRSGNPDAGADEVSNGDIVNKPLSIHDVGPEDKSWWVSDDYYAMGMILWDGVPLHGYKVELTDYAVTLPGGTDKPPVVEAYLWEGSKARLEITQPTSIDGEATIRVVDLEGNTMKLFPTEADAVYKIKFSANADQTKPVTEAEFEKDMTDGRYPTGLTVLFSSADEGGSGVSRVEYRLNGASRWSTYNDVPVAIADGTHVLEYRGIDKAGNIEDIQSVPLKVGPENPPVIITSPPNTGQQTNALGSVSASQENGQSAAKLVVDNGKLEQQLATLADGADFRIPLTDEAQIVRVELNLESLRSLQKKQAVISFETSLASYRVPAALLNLDDIAQQLGESVDTSDMAIAIEIAEPDGDRMEAARQAVGAADLTLAAAPLTFIVKAASGGTMIEVTNFAAYVERIIPLSSDVDSEFATGAVIEQDGSLRPIPTRIVVEGDNVYASIHSLTNSTYAIVSGNRSFADLADHWSSEPVLDMANRLIVDGNSAGRFDPDGEVTRAEFAALLVRSLGLKLIDEPSDFPDIGASAWYAPYVHTAHTYGLISGYEDGTFRPGGEITREQAMTMVARAILVTGLDGTFAGPSAPSLDRFTDKELLSAWAEEGALACLSAGIVTGLPNGTLAPQDLITRAEAAVVLQRLLQQSGLID